MVQQNLKMRNCTITLPIVKEALQKASRVVFVCEAQRKLYQPSAASQVIYVGVPPPPLIHTKTYGASVGETKPFTFLSIGIVCPRKNQLWAVELFKKFAEGKTNVKLVIVGARHMRKYEVDYLESVKAAIGDDCRIEVHGVTDNVDPYYMMADALLFTSTNEVTPMVLIEAMSYEIPVLSTNVAGIPEIVHPGREGYLVEPGDSTAAIACMELLYKDADLRARMGKAGRRRYDAVFDVDIMVEQYRDLIKEVLSEVEEHCRSI
jgi:glycosyltransferase involved in cell wall biosynthesis